MIFFILVQIPLSRISPGLSFITCFVAWFLDNDTKKWVHDVTKCLLSFDYAGLKALYVKELDFNQPDFPLPKDKEDQRTSIDWACLNVMLMISLLLNYSYRIFMAASVKHIANGLIQVTDSFGFEVHFVRFLYWALLDGASLARPAPVQLGYDLWLLAMIIPLYWMGLHFLHSPIDILYTGKL